MKNVIILKKPVIKEKESGQKAKIIKFPEIPYISEKEAPPRSKSVKITPHYLYYRGRKIPISQFEKAGYGKLLRLLLKEIS